MVYGAPMLAVLCWWFISARKWFKGPKVNVDHMMLGRDVGTLEGQDVSEDSGPDSGVQERFGEKSGVPGEMPPGVQIGDLKPQGL